MKQAAVGLLKTVLAAVIVIPFGVGIGKAIEYGTVDLLGDRLGFDGAALLGTAVFVALALMVSKRWTRWQARKRPPDRSGGPSLP
ncbi:hypothetical protein EEB18_003770 [Sphingopyxis sp. OPL5]|uniref:hypothetical protein n=1 Tax=unclassified Sphingopyxis TaxID=2614943 RepID=UPI0006F34658|nr:MULTISPECIES: hypothetical protein [unclassified Sphingopyxis]KQZ60858.1 hypothetical protein ASD67_16285 [Sphingopyxis sp. Root1497]QNO28093.1 hypothetical protein EEB18_003770 [Sphingopyxis sp. OPL5]